MSDRDVRTRPEGPALARRGVAGEDVLVPLTIYAGFSLMNAVFLAVGGARQIPVPVSVPGYHVSSGTVGGSYWGSLDNWDGQWFRAIAESGYPVPPVLEGNHLAQSEWAFLPLYPMLMRAVHWLTGLPFHISGWLLSICFGAGATVLIYRLVVGRMGRFGAGAMVACLCAFPTAVLMQVTYPESLALLLVACALTALRARRYELVLLSAFLLALTRPIVLPLALVVAVHGLMRVRNEGRGFAMRDRWYLGGVAVATASFLGLWPLLADLMSGHRNTYLDTLAAWPVNVNSKGVFGGWFGSMTALTTAGVAALFTILFVALLAMRKAGRLWGTELRTWLFVYPLYLFAATRPSPSIIRYLMLAIAPMWPFVETSTAAVFGQRTRSLSVGLLAAVLSMELFVGYLWTTHVYTFPSFDAVSWFP